MSPRLSRIQGFSHTFVNNLAAVHDVDVIRKLPAEVQILFHQQDRHAGGIPQIFDRPPDFLDDGWLNTLGRLVQYEDFGTCYQRTPNGKLLLLSAGQVTPRRDSMD